MVKGWRDTLVLNELNLLVPLLLLTNGIYSRDHVRDVGRRVATRDSLCLVVAIARVIITWIAILIVAWAGWTRIVSWSLATVLAVVAVGLADIEYHATTELMVGRLDVNERRYGLLYFLLALMPVNYMFNIVADRSTTVKLVYATLQAVLRTSLATFVFLVWWVYPDYRLAWSCYMSKPVDEYVHGYCPAFTDDYGNNFACRNAETYNIACYPGLGNLDSWRSPHVVTHIAVLLTAGLYGQHALNVWVMWVRLANDNVFRSYDV